MSKRRRLEKALRTAIAIIRNDAHSPIWHHAPEHTRTLNRWCDELLTEAGIEEFRRPKRKKKR